MKSSHYMKKIRNYRKKALVELRGGKCELCDYSRNINALDFHHTQPKNKSFNISGNNLSKYTFEQLQHESNMCILLCKNCHAEIHSNPV